MYTFFTDLANRCVLTLDSQLTQRCRNDRMTAVIIITIIIVMLVILRGGGGGGRATVNEAGEKQSHKSDELPVPVAVISCSHGAVLGERRHTRSGSLLIAL